MRGEPRVNDFRDMPVGYTGSHICGEPAWYRSGVPSDPARPPVLYGPDGIPVCCNPGKGILWGRADGARGGIMWGRVPEPPPPATSYIYEPGTGFERTLTQIGFELWIFSDGFSNYTLEGPSHLLHPGLWEFRLSISVFLNGVWQTAAWDGTGLRLFDWVSGTGTGGQVSIERGP